MKKVNPVPVPLELEDADTPEYCDIIIVHQGAVIAKVLNADSFPCVDDEQADEVDAQVRATADKIILSYNAFDDLQKEKLELIEVINRALFYLESDHIQSNKFRLGVLGQQDINFAIQSLKKN